MKTAMTAKFDGMTFVGGIEQTFSSAACVVS
jgi:hypothetical protein